MTSRKIHSAIRPQKWFSSQNMKDSHSGLSPGLRPEFIILFVSTCHRSACTTTIFVENWIFFSMKQWYGKTTRTKLDAARLMFQLFHVYMCHLRQNRQSFAKTLNKYTPDFANMQPKHIPNEKPSTGSSIQGQECGSKIQIPHRCSETKQSHPWKTSQKLFTKTKLQKLYTQINRKELNRYLELHFKISQ